MVRATQRWGASDAWRGLAGCDRLSEGARRCLGPLGGVRGRSRRFCFGVGIGGRGPGETKLEIDRRRIRDRITALERELQELSRDREQRRSRRVRSGVPIISIVGYTNAGKSTLLNALTQSEIFTENLLFATLDTSSRRLRLPRDLEVIITDTVGFIRNLPAGDYLHP